MELPAVQDHATSGSQSEHPAPDGGATRVLTLSTVGFTLFFAVWVMFAIVGLSLRDELGLSDAQFALLAAIPILTGSVLRVPLGILADVYGGRRVFTLLLLVTAIPTYLVSGADTYLELLAYALLVGLAGTSFAVGIAWVSACYPPERQGFALGMFGAGNVGASITKLLAPTLISAVAVGGLAGGLIPGGWRFVPFLYAVLLILMAIAVWVITPHRDIKPASGRSLRELLAPLKHVRVWRFGYYYVVVFGAYVALALWLPKYYVDVFDVDLKVAGVLTALFIFPASLLRPVGGALADRFGARRVMYWVFATISGAALLLSFPNGHISLHLPESIEPTGVREVLPYDQNIVLFTILVFIIGVAMGVGKAAVYKYIPDYFPHDVGAVGGLVGAIGGLGGFYLPLLFVWALAGTDLPNSTFFVLFLFAVSGLVWLHLTVIRILRTASPHLRQDFEHRAEDVKIP
jgi:NNP family nitrate/nitrite transporter-like MFS transporter